MLKMCNRAVSRAVQGEGKEKRVSMGERNIVRVQGRWIPAMSCIQVFHQRKPGREAMKGGKEWDRDVAPKQAVATGSYPQQFQSFSAAGHLTAVVCLPCPGCSFQPLCRCRAPKVPCTAHAIPHPS